MGKYRGSVKIVVEKDEKELREILSYKDIHPLIRIAATKIFRNEKIEENYFSSKMHYKMYVEKFRKLGKVVDMKIAPHYIFVITRSKRWFLVGFWDKWYRYYDYVYQWVFGINSDGKLFINLVGSERYDKTDNKERFEEYDNLWVGLVDDWNIRQFHLQYDIDSNDLAEITLNEYGKIYRVQGEITMELSPPPNLNSFLNDLTHNTNVDLVNLIENYLIRKTILVLNYIGFGRIEIGRMGRDRVVVVRNAIPRYYDYHNRELIEKRLKELLRKSIGEGIDVRIPLRGEWDNPYLPILIEFSPLSTQKYRALREYIEKEIKKKVKEAIEKREKKTYTTYIGVHRITIESIPRTYTIEIPKELNPLVELYPETENITITATTQRYYVLPGFKATIYHPEHGSTAVKFEKEGILEINTTFVDFHHGLFQNRIAVRMLLDGENVPIPPF